MISQFEWIIEYLEDQNKYFQLKDKVITQFMEPSFVTKVVCKRRKKRNTRRPNSWRTFWSFRQFASHYRQGRLHLLQRDPNCRRFWPHAPIIGRKVGCYALLRLLHLLCRWLCHPSLRLTSWQWLTILRFLRNGWRLPVIAGNGGWPLGTPSLLMRRNNFLISGHTPCLPTHVYTPLINRPCIIL